jgi:peptide/nickel transport system substrate-binding protein
MPASGGSYGRLAVVLAVAVLGLVACGGGGGNKGGGTTSGGGGTLVDGTTDTVTKLDPAGNYDFGSFTLDVLIFNNLLAIPPGGTKPQPSLATSCDFNANDLTTYTCQLRKNVKFSDGSTFDSQDVKFSFDRVVDIKDESGIYTLLSNLKSVTADSPTQVTFHLKEPQSTWGFILTTGAGFIVPKGVFPAKSLQPDSRVVGTGPYKLVKFQKGQQAVFDRNDDYWGPKAKNSQLIVRYFDKSSTMKLSLQNGDIDMAFQTFTPTEIQSLKSRSGVNVFQGKGTAIRYLVMNVTKPPTDKLAVRQAVAHLMPRQTIAQQVYNGTVAPLYSMPPPQLPGHIDAFKSEYGASPSPAKAKQVLQKAGISTPVPITIWWTPSHYGDASADEYAEIKRGLEADNIFKVTLKSAEWGQYSDACCNGTYPTYQLGWFPDYPDVEDYITPFYASDAFVNDGYKSAKMDSLISKERKAKTETERLGFLKQAQTLAAKDVPIVPYWNGNMIVVGRDNVHGIPNTIDPAFILRFWLLSKS